MRPHKHSQQGAGELLVPIEAVRPSATNLTAVVGPPGADPAPARPEPDLSMPPRLSVPDCLQLLSPRTIEELLEPDHPAHAVRVYVQQRDLTRLDNRIRARGSLAGRSAIDPRLLVALWLYATLSGFTSAGELAVLCIHSDPLSWLAGGVSVNSHALADFPTDNPAFAEQLLKDCVQRWRQQGRID